MVARSVLDELAATLPPPQAIGPAAALAWLNLVTPPLPPPAPVAPGVVVSLEYAAQALAAAAAVAADPGEGLRIAAAAEELATAVWV